jgi:ornithine--oxo-acid transaminase
VQEKLMRRSFEMGKYFMAKLNEIDSPHITQIRGRGLLIGMVLDTKARQYCEALAKKGLLCKETHENVIRFAPPLVISKKEIDWACRRIADVMEEVG